MDKYTKFILTIIAVCLVIQTGKDIAFVEPAYANQVQKMAICREDGSLCLGFKDYGYDDDIRGGWMVTRPRR